MKKLVFILATIVLAATTSNLYAQSERLSDEDKNEMKERIVQKLTDFQDYLGMIVKEDNREETKDKAISAALELFIGKGKPYDSWDENGKYIYNSGVKMQTSSTSGKKPKSAKPFSRRSATAQKCSILSTLKTFPSRRDAITPLPPLSRQAKVSVIPTTA
jgi:hypothetical protein